MNRNWEDEDIDELLIATGNFEKYISVAHSELVKPTGSATSN
jgi:hypothetical protein